MQKSHIHCMNNSYPKHKKCSMHWDNLKTVAVHQIKTNTVYKYISYNRKKHVCIRISKLHVCNYVYIYIEKSMYSKLISFPLLHKHNTKHLPAEVSPYLTAVRVPTAIEAFQPFVTNALLAAKGGGKSGLISRCSSKGSKISNKAHKTSQSASVTLFSDARGQLCLPSWLQMTCNLPNNGIHMM